MNCICWGYLVGSRLELHLFWKETVFFYPWMPWGRERTLFSIKKIFWNLVHTCLLSHQRALSVAVQYESILWCDENQFWIFIPIVYSNCRPLMKVQQYDMIQEIYNIVHTCLVLRSCFKICWNESQISLFCWLWWMRSYNEVIYTTLLR